MCAGARATGSRARSGSRGDRYAVSLRGKTPRADPLARRGFPPLHVAPRPSSSAPNMIPFRAFSMVCREEKFPCNSQAAPSDARQRTPFTAGVAADSGSFVKRQVGRYATLSCGSSTGVAHCQPRPCTTSCGFESSGTIPFPGADSIFSSLCGAISGRLRLPSGSLAPRSRRPKRLGSKDRRSARRSPPGRRYRNKYRTTTRLWEEKTPGFRKRIFDAV